MASLRRPSIDSGKQDSGGGGGQRTPSPRSRDHDLCDGHGLPGGSSLFQEVMAELHPSPSPEPQTKSPQAPRRRRSSVVKNVHYVIDDGRRKSIHSHDNDEDEEEELGPDKQILHGKCHCYFVEHGKVTGLADHRCHHEHRLHPLHPGPPPPSSPRPARKNSISSTSTPEGSPPSRNKHHPPHHLHHHHHHSSLHPPDPETFRGRSNSDCEVLGRAGSSSSKRSSLSPSPGTSPRKTSPVRGSSLDKERGDFPSSARMGRRRSSLKHEEVAAGMSSLHISSPPPPILVQDTDPEASSAPWPGGERRGRRLSTHSVDSEQLHYLYDQFLAPGGAGGASGH